MTAKEFQQEVLAKYPKDYGFTKLYERFQENQRIALNILKEFHAICEKHHIHYVVIWGLLLGIIRDNTQIPWDHDIDVLISYTDKERVLAALEKDLDANYRIQQKGEMLRLLYKDCNLFYLDVVFLTGLPDNEQESKLHMQKIMTVSRKIDAINETQKTENFYNNLVVTWKDIVKSVWVTVYNKLWLKIVLSFRKIKGKEERSFFYACKHVRGWGIRGVVANLYRKYKWSHQLMTEQNNREDEEEILEDYQRLMSMYPFEGSNYCCEGSEFGINYCGGERIPTRFFSPAELRETDIGTFRVPAHPEELLRLIYGDYMKVPSLEKRLEEVLGWMFDL